MVQALPTKQMKIALQNVAESSNNTSNVQQIESPQHWNAHEENKTPGNSYFNMTAAEKFFTYNTEGSLRRDIVSYSAAAGVHRF